jgi:sugar lactone lactonase YvrE
MAITAERIGTQRNILGEGPLWDVAEQALYWVDGEGRLILRYDAASGAIKSWQVPATIGSMALRAQGGAVIALKTGIHLFDFENGRSTPIADPEGNDPRTRFNDGKVDARGRFICATIDVELSKPLGSLYRLDPNLTCTRLDSGFALSNGPCWSPDGSTFYFSDSRLATIFRFDYDLESGTASARRVFADTRPLGGMPDGCTVDANGSVWSALIGTGKVACFNADGSVNRLVDVPPRLVTSVMFGGRDLDVLYVTSIGGFAAEGIEPGEADGSLWAIHGLGVRGRPEPRFAG